MQRFHGPEDEKRRVVILDPGDFEDWLAYSMEESDKCVRQWDKPLDAASAPLPP